MDTPPDSDTHYLAVPGGRIAYDVSGSGPLVLLVPGMGDLRASYRLLAPALRDGGFRVAVTDLRGHGDSDASFPAYGDEETARDLVALLEELGSPGVVVGNSMGAAAAVVAAAERPDLVRALVLIGPFVRDPRTSAPQRLFQRVATAPAWAATVWKWFLPSLYAGRRPADFDAYRERVVANLRRPGYARAFSRTTRTSHRPAEERLGAVRAPTLVLMGERDPDFKDPAGEAHWVADQVNGTAVLVPDAGHYPQAQRPDVVTPSVLTFLADLDERA